MKIRKLLIANRGEIAIRIGRTANTMGIATYGIHSQDDSNCLHNSVLDKSLPLKGHGISAYLDGKQIIDLAKKAGCEAIHPGYGFLSEDPEFVRQVEDHDLIFVGPTVDSLQLFGNKIAARHFASSYNIPVPAGTDATTSLDQASEFFQQINSPIVIKAVAGGGGRGMRVVSSIEQLESSYKRCQSEANRAFNCPDLYVEQYLDNMRHIEVQICGNGKGEAFHLWERDCSLQRLRQKIVELAPAPNLPSEVRSSLLSVALLMAKSNNYRGLGTFEFLVAKTGKFVFIEANPRLQVEHCVTEMITGIDLVALQLQIAMGTPLPESWLKHGQVPPPKGMAIQLRILAEAIQNDGNTFPDNATITHFEPPGGLGIRLDHMGYTGYASNANFDSLLAKLIVHHHSLVVPTNLTALLRKAKRALQDFIIKGPTTNKSCLQALLNQPDLQQWLIDTDYFGNNLASLLPIAAQLEKDTANKQAKKAQSDPLAILNHTSSPSSQQHATSDQEADSAGIIRAPMQCSVVSVDVKIGDHVVAGQQLLILEAMKMEHVIQAPTSGVVEELFTRVATTLTAGSYLLRLRAQQHSEPELAIKATADANIIRKDLAEVQARNALLLDENRSSAVARRHKTNHRTARENIADLCDPDSFVEYGPLVIAAQRRRRKLDDLINNTQADGLIAGLGQVNGKLFGEHNSQCILMSYDYMVLAGTQGQQNHRKKDRMFELAEQLHSPIVLFAEGGGGRPGDSDGLGVAGLDCMAFYLFARLSGLIPLVGIVSGRCFAGNAALLGCCDVTIATVDANIGMGGPAMIEGAGLGTFTPEEIGPTKVQANNGVIDVLVKDEAAAVAVAKQYLGYFQGQIKNWQCSDQKQLRTLIPENRLRVYDVHSVIDCLTDIDSSLEIRKDFAPNMVTTLSRIEGRPIGIIANNPQHLGAAIDSHGADKASRFMQLCDAFNLPILFLCDCPGIMVGPDAEATALVRHASRMFITGASLNIPFFTIILRKSYGLGAQAMAGGSFKATLFTVSWPTGEFGGMGLEGAVKLGYRKELAAQEDPQKRQELYKKMVASMYNRGKVLNVASHFEIDGVIDPAESRTWILRTLKSIPPVPPQNGKKRPCIDSW